MAENISELKRINEKLRRENKKLNEKNLQMRKEQNRYKGLYRDTHRELDTLGRGVKELLNDLKDTLGLLQSKVETFKEESPLSYLELYD